MTLHVSVCERCEEMLVPPRTTCPECRGKMETHEVDGAGQVLTHTTVYVVPEGFEAPIKVGLIKLDAGGQVLARADFDLEIGQRVRVEELDDGTHRALPAG